jgi:hypothetical protein
MRRLLFLMMIFCPVFSVHSACHPIPSAHEHHHIIGYGSLIQKSSRLSTNPHATFAYPLELHGYKRAWQTHGGNYKTTFLAITPAKHSSLNAIYYSASPHDIDATDKREAGYCRVRVTHNNIKPLGLKTIDSGAYWIYLKKTAHLQPPSIKYPLVQSYVDIFLDGCIQISNTYRLNKFKEKCITETSDWPNTKGFWINDRIHARRPFKTPNAKNIDHLLSHHFKNYYNHPYE